MRCPWFAQVHMHVEEPWRCYPGRRITDVRATRRIDRIADSRNVAIDKQEIRSSIEHLSRVQESNAFE